MKTDDAAFTPATDKVLMVGAFADETTPDSVNEGDAGALRMTLDRVLRTLSEFESNSMRVGGVAATPKFAVISAASSGDNTIVAGVASNKLRVLAGMLLASGTVSVRFESGAGGTALTGVIPLTAQTGFQIPFCPVGNFETASAALLNLELSGAVGVYGWIVYVEVPA